MLPPTVDLVIPVSQLNNLFLALLLFCAPFLGVPESIFYCISVQKGNNTGQTSWGASPTMISRSKAFWELRALPQVKMEQK